MIPAETRHVLARPSAPTSPEALRALRDELDARADGWMASVDPTPRRETLLEPRVAEALALLETERTALLWALRAAIDMAADSARELDDGWTALVLARLRAWAGQVHGYSDAVDAVHAVVALYAEPQAAAPASAVPSPLVGEGQGGGCGLSAPTEPAYLPLRAAAAIEEPRSCPA